MTRATKKINRKARKKTTAYIAKATKTMEANTRAKRHKELQRTNAGIQRDWESVGWFRKLLARLAGNPYITPEK